MSKRSYPDDDDDLEYTPDMVKISRSKIANDCDSDDSETEKPLINEAHRELCAWLIKTKLSRNNADNLLKILSQFPKGQYPKSFHDIKAVPPTAKNSAMDKVLVNQKILATRQYKMQNNINTVLNTVLETAREAPQPKIVTITIPPNTFSPVKVRDPLLPVLKKEFNIFPIETQEHMDEVEREMEADVEFANKVREILLKLPFELTDLARKKLFQEFFKGDFLANYDNGKFNTNAVFSVLAECWISTKFTYSKWFSFMQSMCQRPKTLKHPPRIQIINPNNKNDETLSDN